MDRVFIYWDNSNIFISAQQKFRGSLPITS